MKNKNKILLIVEGENTEPKLFKRLSQIKWPKLDKVDIIDIRTNIYALYTIIKKYDEDFFSGSTSVIDVLKEHLQKENRDIDLKKLEGKFSYIYLSFDLDIQDNRFETIDERKECLKEMLNYFNDETENGLLFINYPMIESFRDYTPPPIDYDYVNRTVSLNELSTHKYKCVVDKRGDIRNYSKLFLDDLEKIFLQNVMKANYIVDGSFSIPNYEIFLDYMDGKKILNKQLNFLEDENKIYVLCTCLFLFISFFGEKYYRIILERHNLTK